MPKMAVIAKLTAKEGKRAELVAAFEAMFTAVNDEAGTEIYALHEDLADADSVWFYELYTDGDATTAHSQSDTMKAAGATLAGLLAGRPELHLLNPLRAKGVTF